MLIKGDPEPGAMPSEELLAALGKYNDELKEAEVLLALAGLHPSGEGKRVRFSGGQRTAIDGPFGEKKDAVAGYWILQVESMDEAVEWATVSPLRLLPGSTRASTALRARSRSVRSSRWSLRRTVMSLSPAPVRPDRTPSQERGQSRGGRSTGSGLRQRLHSICITSRRYSKVLSRTQRHTFP